MSSSISLKNWGHLPFCIIWGCLPFLISSSLLKFEVIFKFHKKWGHLPLKNWRLYSIFQTFEVAFQLVWHNLVNIHWKMLENKLSRVGGVWRRSGLSGRRSGLSGRCSGLSGRRSGLSGLMENKANSAFKLSLTWSWGWAWQQLRSPDPSPINPNRIAVWS